MSARRASIQWPFYLTCWVSVAGFYAGEDGNWVVVACAALMVLAAWGMYATERRL